MRCYDDRLNERERIPCRVFKNAREAGMAVARQIADLTQQRSTEGKTCVLGLPTGSTPLGVYDELVRLHREEGLSLKNVVTFNLDEYYPMQPEELQSFRRFMNEHLFDLVDIDPRNIHIPDGTLPAEQVGQFCGDYEDSISQAGGIDLQILGVGRTGHVGFNEPGSGKTSRTRLITLDRVTRLDAASDFFGEEYVPRRAITMGVGTILDARRIVLIAFGEHKAPIIAESVEGQISASVAASFLQQHSDAQVILDEAAAEHLTRRRCPWILGSVTWNDSLVRKALIWLATKLGKPILKLTEEDYNESGLQDLLAQRGTAYEINLAVFRQLQATITGWPGGKPEHEKQPGDRPQPHEDIFPKRLLVFSPHPDDDVISMGGTLIRLIDQDHEVHIAYQTSGNIAVFDDDVIRFCEFVDVFNQTFEMDSQRTTALVNLTKESLKNKKSGHVDGEVAQAIKTLIRRGEARAAARSCGVAQENLHFLNMPFYETGRVRKKPLSDQDITILVDLLQELQPHQIYVAGDLSDPHGTHRTCLRGILKALGVVKEADWFSQCDIWLYRGAWHEWEPYEIDMAVPLSPQEVMRKRTAIYKHESQKDRALFPGFDLREFWQRAEDRNRHTAAIYDALGFAEYEAIEGFVRWTGLEDLF